MKTLQSGALRFLALSLLLFLAACKQDAGIVVQASGGPAVGSTPAGAPLYVVGADASYPPFEYLDDHRAVQGYDVDLLNAVAAAGGFRVKFVDTRWEDLFQALQQGRRDILASSVSITPLRKTMMDFSTPYLLSRQLIAVGRGQDDIRSFHDLKSKKRVGVQADTSADVLAQSLLGKSNPAIKRFGSMTDALLSLETGQVDAVIGDSGMVRFYVKNHRQAGVVVIEDTTYVSPEYYGFAVRKGNPALLERINAGLAAVKASGVYDALNKKYFADEM